MMKRCFLIIVLIVCCLQKTSAQYIEGELFVKVETIAFSPEQLEGYLKINYDLGEVSVEAPFILDNTVLQQTYVLKYSEVRNIEDLIIKLTDESFISYAEKIPKYDFFFTPNDIQAQQWNLQKIQAELAWNFTQGNSNVVIAMVDDAVLLSHQDLNSKIWINTAEIASNGIDDDGNGYVDDINGWDAADNDNDPNPFNPTNSSFTHGTHCAGIAGAATNNGVGISSIGFNSTIMPVKIAASNTQSLTGAFAGVQYAIINNADVISMSWGGGGYSITFQTLFDQAYAQGIVCVAASGNSNTNIPMYPAAYNHVISVGATDISDARASFSNYGSTIDVMAPGVGIYSTLAGSNSSYGNLSGTSMACPLVSGLAALMLSYDPSLSPDDLEACLKSSCDNINAQNPSYIGQIGAGRVNAFAAIQCLKVINADFTSNTQQVCQGGNVQFSDLSNNNPISWNWSFLGGTPATSILQNPIITYSTNGIYNVTLTSANALGSDTKTITNYITVAQPTALMNGSTTLLSGFSANIPVTFTGVSPWNFIFTDGISNFTINNVTTSPYYLSVSPTVNTTYSLVSVNDVNCGGNISGQYGVTIVTGGGCAQGTAITFQKVYGGTGDERAHSIQQTADGGYVVVGETTSFGAGGKDWFVMKIDVNGVEQWTKTYGGVNDEDGYSIKIKQTNDLGYIVCGYTQSFGAGSADDSYILRLDNLGGILWEKRITGSSYDRFRDVVELTNGDFVLTGSALSTSVGNNDAHLVKISATGSLIWIKNTGTTGREHSEGIIKLIGSGFMLSGNTNISDTRNAFLMKIDDNGIVIWSKEYGGNSTEDDFLGIILLSDGNILSVGRTESYGAGNTDIWLVKTDTNGVVIWSKTYGGINDEIGVNIREKTNGEIIISAFTNSYGGGNELLLINIDGLGNVLWSKTYGGSSSEELEWWGESIALNSTDEIIFGGGTRSFGVGNEDIYIIKTNECGESFCNEQDVSLSVSSPVIIGTTFNVQTVTGGSLVNTTTTANTINFTSNYLCTDTSLVTPICLNIKSVQKISDTQGNFTGLFNNNDRFESVCNLGDFNGDGINDILAGAKWDDDGGTDKGAIYILYMNANATVNSFSKISDTQGNFGGLASVEVFGTSVDTIGDLNNDGVMDIVVGASEFGGGVGAVHILFLNANGTVQSSVRIASGSGGFPTGIISGNAEFGGTVSCLNDLNGDGTNDLLIGSNNLSDGGTNRGALFIIFLNSNGTVQSYQKISSTTGGFLGVIDNGDGFGMIEDLGDYNNDGIRDIAVGAIRDDDGGLNKGAVWILSIDNTGNVVSYTKISDTQGNFSGVLNVNDEFGWSVSSLGDIDGDGIGDMLVGAIRDDDGGGDKGAAYILMLNANGSVKQHFTISDLTTNFTGYLDNTDWFGLKTSSIGDFDGNGMVDILVSSGLDDDGGTDRGAFYIFFLEDSCALVSPQVCNISANFSSTVVCIGDSVGFTNSSIDSLGNIINWQWYFDDGDSLIGIQNPSHLYATADTFNVKLIVINDANPFCTDTITKEVIVLDTLTINLPQNDTICIGDSIYLGPINLVCGKAPYSYLWLPSIGLNNDTISNPLAGNLGTITYVVTVTDSLGVIAVDSITIVVDSSCCKTFALIGGNLSYCEGDSVQLVNNSVFSASATYSWDFGGATPSSFIGYTPPVVTYPSIGAHTVRLILNDSCGIDTSYFNVNIFPLPILPVLNDTVLCLSDTFQIGDVAISNYNYLWTPGLNLSDSTISNPLAYVLTSMTYVLTVTDPVSGCSNLDTLNILLNGFIPVSDTVLICQGDSVLLGGVFQNSSGNYIDSLQTINGCDSILSTNLIVNPVFLSTQNQIICQGDSILFGGVYYNSTGTYTGSLQTSLGCDSLIILNVTVNPSFQFNLTETICFGDSVFIGGSFQYTSGIYSDTLQTILNCDSIISTVLTVGNVYNDTLNVRICQGDSILLGGAFQNSSGNYIDSLQTINGCDSTLFTNLKIDSLIILTGLGDVTSTPCNAVQLSVSGGNSYFWSPSLGLNCTTCPNPIASPNITTIYTVTENSNSCNVSYAVTVFIEGDSEFIIPNVFSPNGDGNNDGFNIKTDCIHTINKKVFNRWGELLFESNQINEVWNGRTTSGEEVPEGTYFYIFNVETFVDGVLTSKIFKGTVSLLR